jgi:hypothetical protein
MYERKLGRKGLYEELKLGERYAKLTPKYFAVLEEFLESDIKSDRMFAVEQLSKIYPKTIPQDVDVTSGGEPFQVVIQRYGGESDNNPIA